MSNLASAKLFVRVAVLRRKVILRQSIRRAIAGALAVASFIVAAGFATYALFLTVRAPLGELGAVAAVAALYLVIAVGLLLYTLHEPVSPELDALAEMENAALETLFADNQGVIQSFAAAGHRIENLGNTVSLSLSVLSALRRLLSAKRGEKPQAPA
jgi:hypothetical protein